MTATPYARPDREAGYVRLYVKISDRTGDTLLSLCARIRRTEWNDRAREVRPRHAHAQALNEAARSACAAALGACYAAQADGRVATREEARAAAQVALGRAAPEREHARLYDLIAAEARAQRAAGKIAMAAKVGTTARHMARCAALIAAPGLRVDALTPYVVRRMDEALARPDPPHSRGLTEPSRASVWRAVSGVLRRGAEAGEVPRSAYEAVRTLRLSEEGTKKAKLSLAELRRVEAVAEDEGLPVRTREAAEVFVAAVYLMGARVGDVLRLCRAHVETGPDGAPLRVAWRMNKTGAPMRVPVSGVAARIIARWMEAAAEDEAPMAPFARGREWRGAEADYEMVKRGTALLNKHLGAVAACAGIGRHISSHSARYTFGGVAREAGLSMDDIQALYRHGSGKVTEGYMHDLSQEEVEARALRALGGR